MTARQRQGRLADKRALVTGASSGIGAATARLFAAEGARLALVARRRDRLEALAAELGDERACAIAADVTSPGEVRAAIDEAWAWLGGLDVVVNCAGMVKPMKLGDLTPEVWQTTLDVNLSGTFYVSREAGLRMAAAGGGTIVNIGSELGTLGMPTNVPYCAAKAGVVGLTKALAAELIPSVTVNVVCAGPVDTPLLRGAFEGYCEMYSVGTPEEVADATRERIPLKRLATPEEAASAILYLAADAAYATGTTLELDGGSTSIV